MTAEERERFCERMHDAYEAAAAKNGWETQARSRVPWSDVPEANKATMRAAVDAALPPLLADRDAALAVTDDELRIMAAEMDALLKMPLSGDTIAPSWVSIALDAVRARRLAALHPAPRETP